MKSSTSRDFIYDATGFPAGGLSAYLSTVNNTAVIQSGHPECDATADEQKLWANLIYYLKKRTEKTARIDYFDLPPSLTCACAINEDFKYDISCEIANEIVAYDYRFEAYNDTNDVVGISEAMSIDIWKHLSHFMYLINDEMDTSKEEILYIVAVDQSGSITPQLSYNTSKCSTPTLPFVGYASNGGRRYQVIIFAFIHQYLE